MFLTNIGTMPLMYQAVGGIRQVRLLRDLIHHIRDVHLFVAAARTHSSTHHQERHMSIIGIARPVRGPRRTVENTIRLKLEDQITRKPDLLSLMKFFS